MIKVIFTILFFVLYVGNIFSQQSTYRVEGSVYDKQTNEALPAVTVSLWNALDSVGTVVHQASEANGSFSIEVVRQGNYRLKVSYIGKQSYLEDVKVSKKKTTLKSIYLENSSINLDELVVQGRVRLVQVTSDKLTYNVERDPDSRSSSILYVLEKVPMISVDGNEQIQINGSSDFKIFVNGRPSSLFSSNPTQILKSMPAEAVRSIEVITDPGARYDAESAGGILNIIMSRSVSNGYSASLGAKYDRFGALSANTFYSLKRDRLGLSVGYIYDRDKTPYSNYYSNRKFMNDAPGNILSHTGSQKAEGVGHIGYAEMSYELDSANLLNVSFDIRSKYDDDFYRELVELNDEVKSNIYTYWMDDNGRNLSDVYSLSADYQQHTRKKGEFVTFSYRFDYLSGNQGRHTNLYDAVGADKTSIVRYTKDESKDKEQTFQIDFVSPWKKGNSMELGAKYIMRAREGYETSLRWDDSRETWYYVQSNVLDFSQDLNILSIYNSYSFRLMRKWRITVGARAEYTYTRLFFPDILYSDTKNDYLNVIPTLQSSFKLNDNNNFRLSYNMRIHRPGIKLMNPYKDDSDPTNIFFGNPQLEAEENHRVALRYSYFGSSLDIDANVSHSFTDNSIHRYSYYENDVINNTYANLGRKQQSVANLYLNWAPTSRLRMIVNASAIYTDIKSDEIGIEGVSGFSNRISANVSCRLPYDYRIVASGGYIQPSIRLQTKGSPYRYTRFSLHKSIADDRLNIALSVSNPFTKETKYEYITNDPNYWQEEVGYRIDQKAELKFTYRIGKLSRSAINKTSRNILNDDIIPVSKEDDKDELLD